MTESETRTALRICLCTTFYPPWSADADGQFVQRLANGLARRGHDVTVVHSPAAHAALRGEPAAASYDDLPAVTHRQVPIPLGRLGLLAVHQAGRPVGHGAALRDALAGPFDVIHYHNVSLLGGPAAFGHGHADVKLGSLNDHWLVCPMHLLWKYTGEVCDSPRCVTCCIRQGRPPQPWRGTALLQRMTQHVDAFLGPSVFTIRKHLERGFERPMIHLPPLYTVPQPLVGPRRTADLEVPYFLCVGRLETYKGFQDVIPVFGRFPDHRLIVCGDGDFGDRLRALAADLPNVYVENMPSQNRLQALYEGAIATIVPSRCYQTFCHVTAESFSAGTPVIAFRRSAVEEILTEHGGGILYASPEGLEEAIATLIRDSGARSALGARALETYREQFTEEVYLDRYLRIVRELLRQKRRHGALREYDSVAFAGRPIFGFQTAPDGSPAATANLLP